MKKKIVGLKMELYKEGRGGSPLMELEGNVCFGFQRKTGEVGDLSLSFFFIFFYFKIIS